LLGIYFGDVSQSDWRAFKAGLYKRPLKAEKIFRDGKHHASFSLELPLPKSNDDSRANIVRVIVG